MSGIIITIDWEEVVDTIWLWIVLLILAGVALICEGMFFGVQEAVLVEPEPPPTELATLSKAGELKSHALKTTIYCKQCAAVTPRDSKFCKECGTSIS